jgi:PIN domain nuclease of toxin-antitoxin system
VIVLDTHAWIWWLRPSPELSPRVTELLDQADQLVLPSIVIWEVAMLVRKQRIQLPTDQDLEQFVRIALAHSRTRLWPLTPRIGIRAGLIGTELHGDPADRLIVATALELGAPLATRDERIRALVIPGLLTAW